MQRTLGPRPRQLVITAVFIVGALASIATSPVSTSIDIPAQRATLRLDAEHPTALTRFFVALNAEASAGSGSEGARLRITSVRAAGESAGPFGGPFGAMTRARFIVASVQPAVPPSPGPELPGQLPVPSPFEAEVQPGSETSLPLSCGLGPCERAFWLIAELADPAPGPVDIELEVSARIQYYTDTWPSGAGGTIAIEPPTLLAGPTPNLVASTAPEVINLGPRQPAAARVVEVSVGGDAIDADARVAVLTVTLSRRPGAGVAYDERPPIVSVYPLDDALDDAAAPLPTGLDPEPDPFAGCEPGIDCTRRFLVTLEWAGDDATNAAYDWSVTVRRIDLMRAWSTPAALEATVTRRFDVATDRPSTQKLHLAGESMASSRSDQDQVQLLLGATTTATDPLARLLPAPAVMTYRARTLVGDPAATPETFPAFAGISFPGPRMRSINVSLGPTGIEIVTNPLAGCRVGGGCGGLALGTRARLDGPDASVPDVPFEWSLDITLYSFEEAPLTLFSTDISPASG
jgi:hypothetical protein